MSIFVFKRDGLDIYITIMAEDEESARGLLAFEVVNDGGWWLVT